MKAPVIRYLPVFVAALLGAAPCVAQWVHYPTPGIPRAKDGKPDLKAAAPKTAWGTPDFSGIWQLEPNPCVGSISVLEACGSDYQGGKEFGNIGARLNDGLPYQPWAAEAVRQHGTEMGKNDPVSYCKPAGVVRLLTYPPFRKFIQVPGVLVMLSERDVTYRQIFLDGRPLPADPSPTPNGYSSGKWDGDTLVVQTVGFMDGTWLDRRGSPLMEGAKLTEKYRRVDFGNMEIELTVDDPKSYTKPWTVTLHELLVPDTELMDYFCQQNEKESPHMVGK